MFYLRKYQDYASGLRSSNVSAPFEQLIPLVVNIVVFYMLNVLCVAATGVIIPDFILNVFKPLLSASDTPPAMLIYVFLLNALWVIGVNGGNIVNSVMSSVAADQFG